MKWHGNHLRAEPKQISGSEHSVIGSCRAAGTQHSKDENSAAVEPLTWPAALSLLSSWRFILRRFHVCLSVGHEMYHDTNLPVVTGHLWCLNLRLMPLCLRPSCKEGGGLAPSSGRNKLLLPTWQIFGLGLRKAVSFVFLLCLLSVLWLFLKH